MNEQCSSNSTSFIPLLNENKFTFPSLSAQQSTVSVVSSLLTSREWMGPIQVERTMRLDECMNFIAEVSGIQNSMGAGLRRTFRRISATNMTIELLKDMLDDYADLFKINIVILPFDENILIDPSRISLFTGTPDVVDGQSKYKHRVFILYDYRQQMFTPIYVRCIDNSQKVHFDENDLENIGKQIIGFIAEWNHQKQQDSTSTMNNITSNNDGITKAANSCETNNSAAQFPSTSTVDKDVFIPAREVIKNSCQFVLQMVSLMGSQLDHISLKQKSTRALLSNFNRLSDKDKIEMVCNEIISVTKAVRMAMIPDHEEKVEISSMEVEQGRYFAAPVDTNKNLNTQIIHIQQNTLHHSESSTTLKHLTTTSDVREPSMVLPQYAAPKILREPTDHQHVRMFSELAAGICPLMQGGGKAGSQQTYVEIEVPDEDDNDLYVAVRAVTVKKVKHPFKSVLPQNPRIDTSKIEQDGERGCLKCDKKDFDQDSEYTYLPIIPEERTQAQGRQEILAHLINWSRPGAGYKKRVIEENLYLCKLEFYLCIRNKHGDYKFVSPPSYSSIIEQGDGPVNIISNAIKVKQLCDKGGQIIALPLTVTCPKRGFHVRCNGEEWDDKKFKINQKQLLIISPSKKSDNANLHLEILHNEYNDAIGDNTGRTLYEHIFEYISHNNQPVHVCCQEKF